MRPDKVLLAAVAATLALYRAGVAARDIPVWRQIAASIEGLAIRGIAIVGASGHGAQVVETEATVGGGSLPGQVLPSRAVCVPSGAPDALLARLRAGSPAVVGRIEHDRVVLDLRSVEPDDDDALAAALEAALSGHA
jgi:L-seryl-tRNA(Ser) seleniumtransferase